MLVPIKDIKPNPYRDFDLYPYDEEQIENLILSYQDNGDFGVLPARPNGTGSTYELAAGHHRLEAMRRLKFKEADLKIGDYDDDQMINIMVDENAKQMGQNSAAILDSVCASIRRIAYITLTGEWSTLPEFWQGVFTDDGDKPSKKSFDTTRGQIESGAGVGWKIVLNFLERRLTKTAVESALATIKGSDLHGSIVGKVQERIEQERKEAERAAEAARKEAERIAKERVEAKERARKEQEAYQRKIEELERKRKDAERAAKEAKERHQREEAERRAREHAAKKKAEEEQQRANEELRRKREAEAEKMAREMEQNRQRAQATADRRREAGARAGKASAATKTPEHKFDTRVAQLFKNDYQLNLFRRAVTTGTLAQVLPSDRQYDLAKACVDWHKRNGVHLTEKSITDWLTNQLDKFLRHDRKVSKEERDLALKESADRRILRAYDDMRDALTKISSSCAVLKEEYGRYPSGSTPPINTSVKERIPEVIRDLSRLRDRLSQV
jgi:chemotaxis protein histidine kinase CheA